VFYGFLIFPFALWKLSVLVVEKRIGKGVGPGDNNGYVHVEAFLFYQEVIYACWDSSNSD